ncbi:MAG: hypothetical protein HYY04_07580 [Chloroflexi bacterium]|nr:hypothetical protein [Chloroflexota bacterium]
MTTEQGSARHPGGHGWRHHILAIAFFAVWTLVATFPRLLHLADHVDNWGDPLLNTWALAWNVHQALRDPLHLYDANIFYPHRSALAFSESLVGISVFAAPVLLVSGSPVLTYNLMLLAAFFASGFTTYLLAERMTGSRGSGLVAGMVFAFGFHRIGDISHIQTMTAQWIPLVLLCVDHYWGAPGETGRTRYLALAAAAFVLQMLSSFYLGLFLVPLLFLQFIWLAATRPGRLGWRLGRHLLVAAAAVGLVLWPFVSPYLTLRASLGLERSLEDATGAAAVPLNYLVAPQASLLYGQSALARLLSTEQTLFPGVACLALAAAGLRRGRDRQRIFAALIAVTGFVLSLGPGLRLTPGGPVLVPLPYYVLHQFVPGFGAIRLVGRLGLVTMLGLGLLGSFGTAALTSRLSSWTARGVSVGLALLVGFEYLSTPLPSRAIERPDQVPPVYHWLAARPDHSPLIELPTIEDRWFGKAEELERQGRYQYFSTFHWRTTPSGYSGFYPQSFWTLLRLMRDFPTPEALGWLRCADVRQVVLHGDAYGPERWAVVHGRAASYPELVPVATFGATEVYSLSSPEPGTLPAPRLALVPSADGGTVALLAWPNGGVPLAVPPEPLTVTFRWATPSGIAAETRSVGSPSCLATGWSVVPVRAPAEVPAAARVEVAATASGWRAASEPSPAAATDGVALLSWWLGTPETHVSGAALLQTTWQLPPHSGDAWSLASTIRNDYGRAVVQRLEPLFPEFLPRRERAPAGPNPTFHAIGLPPGTPPGRYRWCAQLLGPSGAAVPYRATESTPLAEQCLGQFRIASALAALPESPRLVLLDGLFAPGLHLRGALAAEESTATRVVLYWQAIQPVTEEYVVFVHLVDARGNLVAQHDDVPVEGGYPTSLWEPGELVADPHTLPRPEAGSAGLRLRIGLYTRPSLARVGVRMGEQWSDAVEVPLSGLRKVP